MYSFLSFDDKFLYYTFKISDGNTLAPGLIKSVSTSTIWDIQEMNDFLVITYLQPGGIIHVDYVDPILCKVHKQYLANGVSITGFAKITIENEEYLLLSGQKSPNLFMLRVIPSNIGEIGDFIDEPITWDNIDLVYNVITPSSVDPLNTSTLSLVIESPSLVTPTDLVPVSSSYEYPIALWLDDFNQTFVSNHTYQLNFTWP